MLHKMGRYVKWTVLCASGAVIFQTTVGCADIIQTGLLAFIAGTTYFLARNV